MGIYKIDYSTSTIGSNADKQTPPAFAQHTVKCPPQGEVSRSAPPFMSLRAQVAKQSPFETADCFDGKPPSRNARIHFTLLQVYIQEIFDL